MTRRPWFSSFGPLAWYRPKESRRLEWVELQLTLRSRHLITVHATRTRHVTLVLIGRIAGRGHSGRATTIDRGQLWARSALGR